MTEKKVKKASPVILGAIPSGMGATTADYSYPVSQYFSEVEGVDDHLLNFDVYAVYKYARNAHPKKLFAYWTAAHHVNPWYRFSLDYLNSQIFTNYHFEGSAAPIVEKFWRDNNMYTQIRMLGESTIKYGTGIARKLTDVFENSEDSMFGGIQTLHTPFFDVEQDENWNEKWTYNSDKGKPLSDMWRFGKSYMDDFVIFRPWARPDGVVWGYSPMASCLHSLESLHALTISDLPAACRNFMTAQRIYSMDMENVEEDDHEDHIKEGLKFLTRYNSARASAVAMDSRNELYYMGSKSGGAVVSKLEDVMGFIEPITSCINLNIYLPIGILRQLGANRAIIKRQSWLAYEQIAPAKRYFADEVYRQVISPHIDLEGGDVYLVHDLPFEMQESRMEDAIKLYQGGIVPREYAQVMVDFDEEQFKKDYGLGELTYFEDVQKELLKEQSKLSMMAAKSQPKVGSGKDTRQENEKGEEGNDSVSGSESEVKG